MKKLWSVLLVMIMASSLLAACGGSTNKSNEAKPSSSAEASGTAAPDNSDLIKDGIGTDFGFGPIGHDMEGLVKRMGAKAEGSSIALPFSR